MHKLQLHWFRHCLGTRMSFYYHCHISKNTAIKKRGLGNENIFGIDAKYETNRVYVETKHISAFSCAPFWFKGCHAIMVQGTAECFVSQQMDKCTFQRWVWRWVRGNQHNNKGCIT